MNTILLPFTQLFSLFFFNDPKSALVIHSREKNILRCFTEVTLCSQSHFSQIISDHILITHAYSLPACLEQMIILTLSNASLSLCLRIYYPGNIHGHCRGIRSYSLSVISWNLFLNQHFCSLAVKGILKVKYKVTPTTCIWTLCFTFWLNLFLGLNAFSYLTFKTVKIHEDPSVVNMVTCDPNTRFFG